MSDDRFEKYKDKLVTPPKISNVALDVVLNGLKTKFGTMTPDQVSDLLKKAGLKD